MSRSLDLRISETDLANIRELLSRSSSQAIKADSKVLPRVAGRTPVVAFKKLVIEGNVQMWLDEDSEDIPNVSFDLWCTRKKFMFLEKAYNVASLQVDVDQLKALEELSVSALSLKASKMPLQASPKLSAIRPKGADKPQNVFLSIEVEREFQIDIEIRECAFVSILP
ncbi:hypothetical protein PM082_000455 [Marasmius tenuissimus]|nr:hypothetical protein PM082_000455 [Marasmius tenuissimus]